MSDRNNSLYDSWYSYDFLYNLLNYYFSRNLYYLFYYSVSKYFYHFWHYFLNINWYWLLDLHWYVLYVSNYHRFLNEKFDRCEVLDEKGYLSIDHNKFLLDGPEWHNFLNEDRFLSYHLLINRYLSMTGYFNDLLLSVGLNKVAFLNYNLFRDLFIDSFLDLDCQCFWLLTITMLWVINWLLYEHLCNFSNL